MMASKTFNKTKTIKAKASKKETVMDKIRDMTCREFVKKMLKIEKQLGINHADVIAKDKEKIRQFLVNGCCWSSSTNVMYGHATSDNNYKDCDQGTLVDIVLWDIVFADDENFKGWNSKVKDSSIGACTEGDEKKLKQLCDRIDKRLFPAMKKAFGLEMNKQEKQLAETEWPVRE